MLDKSLRKALLELKDWDKALKKKKDANPSQTWMRNRLKIDRALKDMSLLAESLPDEKQDAVFGHERLLALVEEILGMKEELYEDSKRDDGTTDLEFRSWGPTKLEGRRTWVAAMLADRCLAYCCAQYKIIEKHPSLNKRIIADLEEAGMTARGIAQKVELELRTDTSRRTK